MKKNRLMFLAAAALALATYAVAQAPSAAPAGEKPAAVPTKVATIQVSAAIMNTSDGKKASADLQSKFMPQKQVLEKKQSDIANLQEQLRKGGATMSEDAKNKIARDIDSGQKSFQRQQEDFEADVNQDERKIMDDLGSKMMAVIMKYANQNGYAMVVDINPQGPVLWFHPAIDITQEIIKLYDQAHPPAAGTPATKQAAPPATPPKQAPPPATPPPATKKQ